MELDWYVFAQSWLAHLANYSQIEKIFDVACTLVDVMSCVPIESRNTELGPQDYLNHLIRLISTLRGGDSRYLPLIMAKIRDTLPSVAATLNQPLPNIKLEKSGEDLQDSTASSNSSSPYSTPPFLHYYPLS